jgi:hypothetical protein
MKNLLPILNTHWAAAGAVSIMALGTTVATATEPCGGLGECKALIEINASDGDIGFHFLMDGDDLTRSKILNPAKEKIFFAQARGELRTQPGSSVAAKTLKELEGEADGSKEP